MENRQLRDTNNPEEMIPEPESESPGERDPHGRLPVHGALPPTRNLLLAALPDEDFRRLAPHLEPVALTRGAVLAELVGSEQLVPELALGARRRRTGGVAAIEPVERGRGCGQRVHVDPGR